MSDLSTCSLPGCSNPVKKRGRKFCSPACHATSLRGVRIVELPTCARPGCTNTVKSNENKFCSPTCGNLARRNRPTTQEIPIDVEHDLEMMNWKNSYKRLRKAYADVQKDRGEEERLLRLFQTSIKAFPVPHSPASPKVSVIRDKKGFSTEVPAACWGDVHIGEIVNPEETHGINAYNFDIFQQRLEYYEDRIIDILFNHQRAKFKELVIPSIGDNVSGRIHEELQKYGHQHIIDQTYLGAMCVALFYYRLSRLFPQVRVVAVSGNHGRLDKEKESKQYYKNFDYLHNSIIATLLRNVPNITIDIPKAIFSLTQIAGNRVLISHGHELPPSSFGIPAYAVNRAAGQYHKLMSMLKDHYDYWILGHVHTPFELHNSIVNGCVSGLNEYSIGKLYTPILPVQKLISFHPRYGKAWEYPIRLDLAPKHTKVYTFASDEGTSEALEQFVESQEFADRELKP